MFLLFYYNRFFCHRESATSPTPLAADTHPHFTMSESTQHVTTTGNYDTPRSPPPPLTVYTHHYQVHTYYIWHLGDLALLVVCILYSIYDTIYAKMSPSSKTGVTVTKLSLEL
jgi:hypothetical protein